MTVGNSTVPKWIQKHLSPNEIENLEGLIGEIERKTEGEIVPVLVRQSVLGKIPALAHGRILKQLFYSSDYMRTSADLRAELEFYRARIYNTKKKTGILLFLSFFEHRAVVLADQGISSKLPESTWDEVVRMLTASLQKKKLSEGLTNAIAKCGDILIQHFPQIDTDENQLSNKFRISE